MKVLLIDVDSKIPNIALMKISTFHKEKGDVVDLKELGFSYYPKERNQKIINGYGYDIVYISIIFKINKNSCSVINCNNVYFGGSGYSLDIKLPKEIDILEKDYDLYNEKEFSYGFITRGCIRKCEFCIVPKKEGFIYKANDIRNIIRHKKVIFMDNNILAYKEHIKILKELVALKIKCQFNQGLDIRLLSKENSLLLSKLKYIGEYFFAFDNIKDRSIIESKLRLFRGYVSKNWKIKFFIYCNPRMEIKEDVIFRVNWCKENKVLPYLMRDESCWKSKNKDFYTDLSAYCNQPSIFKKMEFKEFMYKRTKNKLRIKKSIDLFYRGVE